MHLLNLLISQGMKPHVLKSVIACQLESCNRPCTGVSYNLARGVSPGSDWSSVLLLDQRSEAKPVQAPIAVCLITVPSAADRDVGSAGEVTGRSQHTREFDPFNINGTPALSAMGGCFAAVSAREFRRACGSNAHERLKSRPDSQTFGTLGVFSVFS